MASDLCSSMENANSGDGSCKVPFVIYLFVLLLSFDPHLQLVPFGAMVSKIFLRLGFRFLEKFPTEQHPQKHYKRIFLKKVVFPFH